MWGSRPLPEAVTRSTGTGAVFPGSAARSASTRPCTALLRSGLVGPWFGPDGAGGFVGEGGVCRRAAPEIPRVIERLADEGRPHRLPVLRDQATVGLARKGDL